MVNSISFSPDGKTLASGSDDKTIKLWNLDPDFLIRRSCDRIRNYLQHNPNVSESDRRLCDGIGNPELEKVQSGKRLAKLGYLEKAISKFEEAQKINSKVDLNPDTKEVETNAAVVAKELYLVGKLEKAKQQAGWGFVDKARDLLKQAQQLDSEIDLDPSTAVIDKDPKVVARSLAALAKVEEGYYLAEEGQVEKAIALFKEAQQLDSEIDLDPDTEAIDKDPEAVARALAGDKK